MALIQFNVTPDRRYFIVVVMTSVWVIVNANPFQMDAILYPGHVLPVLSFFVTLLSWVVYASTRLCQHSDGAISTISWAINIGVILHLVVHGYSPAFALAALFASPIRKINTEHRVRVRVMIIITAILVCAGSTLVADPRKLQSPGGYAAFRSMDGISLETVLIYFGACTLAFSEYVAPDLLNPVRTIAYGSTLALVMVAVIGFMSNMSEIDQPAHLSALNFYHCVFIFTWSMLLVVGFLMLISMHVLKIGQDAFLILGMTTCSLVPIQWVRSHTPPSLQQTAGVCVILCAMATYAWVLKHDEICTTRDNTAFFACRACALCEAEQIDHALGEDEEQWNQ